MYEQRDSAPKCGTADQPGIGSIIQNNRAKLCELDNVCSCAIRCLVGDIPEEPLPESPNNMKQEVIWQSEMIDRMIRKLKDTLSYLS